MQIDLDSVKVKAFYSYDYDYFNMKPHNHSSVEIMYIESGSAEIDIAGTKNRLKKGQFVAILPSVSHRLFVAEKGRIVNLEIISKESVDTIPFLRELFSEGEKHLILEDTSKVLNAVNEILDELTYRDCNKNLVSLMLYELFILIQKSVENSSFENPKIMRAIKFIDGNFTQELRVSDIAAAIKLNPSYLQRQFKLATNLTIIEYIAKLRIERAKKLMLATTLPITDIAAEVGYLNRQSFFKAFKNLEKVSPSEYIKAQQSEKTSKYIQTPFEV